MIVLNTRNELTNFLNTNELPTITGMVCFAGDLLAIARDNANQISIDDELGFADDGGWIEIDNDGIVIDDAYLP